MIEPGDPVARALCDPKISRAATPRGSGRRGWGLPSPAPSTSMKKRPTWSPCFLYSSTLPRSTPERHTVLNSAIGHDSADCGVITRFQASRLKLGARAVTFLIAHPEEDARGILGDKVGKTTVNARVLAKSTRRPFVRADERERARALPALALLTALTPMATCGL